MQNQFALFIDAVGCSKVAVLLCDPRPMTNGKGTQAVFTFATEFLIDPRDLGHEGPSVRHCAFDRGQFSSSQRLLRQQATLKAVRRHGQTSSTAPFLLYLLDWVVATPCALHDVHKSLYWSMHSGFSDDVLLKNVFASVDSCRKSFQQICSLAPCWLWDALVLLPPQQLEAPEDLNDMWTTCGVHAG